MQLSTSFPAIFNVPSYLAGWEFRNHFLEFGVPSNFSTYYPKFPSHSSHFMPFHAISIHFYQETRAIGKQPWWTGSSELSDHPAGSKDPAVLGTARGAVVVATGKGDEPWWNHEICGMSMDFNGFQWISMAFSGFQLISWDVTQLPTTQNKKRFGDVI